MAAAAIPRAERRLAASIAQQSSNASSNASNDTAAEADSSNSTTVAANGSLVQAKLQVVPGGAFVCIFGGVAHSFHYEAEPGDKLRLTIDEQVVTLEPEVDPSVEYE